MTMTRIFQASSSLTTPDIATDTETETQLSLPWHVVVLNDPVNLMSYVVVVFCKVFGFTHEKARKHMLEVLADAACDAGRELVVTEERGAASDHPVRPGFPEGRYLSFFVCVVD